MLQAGNTPATVLIRAIGPTLGAFGVNGALANPKLQLFSGTTFLRENDDFTTSLDKLTTAINTDYEWVQAHRQLQVKALEWERNNHENSFLLRGKELQDADFQLATNTSKEPHPTDLQREYVLRSRQAVIVKEGIPGSLPLPS